MPPILNLIYHFQTLNCHEHSPNLFTFQLTLQTQLTIILRLLSKKHIVILITPKFTLSKNYKKDIALYINFNHFIKTSKLSLYSSLKTNQTLFRPPPHNKKIISHWTNYPRTPSMSVFLKLLTNSTTIRTTCLLLILEVIRKGIVLIPFHSFITFGSKISFFILFSNSLLFFIFEYRTSLLK